jgi:hypothetical protein
VDAGGGVEPTFAAEDAPALSSALRVGTGAGAESGVGSGEFVGATAAACASASRSMFSPGWLTRAGGRA